MKEATYPPKFFVPYAKDDVHAESVWQGGKAFNENKGHTVSNRRIYSIHYIHNSKACFDKVGGLDRYGKEEILVLLEAKLGYLCCTKNRGVLRGDPILIGKDIADVTDFSDK